MGDEKMSEPHPIHVADDIYALLNHKQCKRHQGCSDSGDICGWPEVSIPSPPTKEDEGLEKLTWPENRSGRVSKEAVEAIVSSETCAYLLRVSGGSFSAEDDLMETIQLFFSHSSLTQEQLTWQFQRANLRSLQVFVETLKSGVYPSSCFLLGPQQKHEAVEEPVPEEEPVLSEKENDPTPTQTGADTPSTSTQTEISTPVSATTDEPPIDDSKAITTTPEKTPAPAQLCSAAGETYQNAIGVDSGPLPKRGDVANAEKRRIPPRPTPPPAKRPCHKASYIPTQQSMGCSAELADLQQHAWFILQSDVRATYPQVGLERHQLEQSLHFIDYFRRSFGQGIGIDFFTQDRILLERGRQNLEALKAAMQRWTFTNTPQQTRTNTPPQCMAPQQPYQKPYQQATPPPNNGSPSAYYSAPLQMNPQNVTPQTSHPPMMTPPHYAGSPPHPQPPQQPLWSRADYDARLNYAVQLQKTQKEEEAARRRRYQEVAMQKEARLAAKRLQTASKTASKTAVKSAAKPVSKDSVVYNAMLDPATSKTAANPSPSTTSKDTTATVTTTTGKSTPASFNPMAPVFKPVVRQVPNPLAEPVVASTLKRTVPRKLPETDTSKKRLPLLPDLVVKRICSHVNLGACVALADTSIMFRRVIRKADASLVRTKVQSRIPWASLAPSESNYTSWFDFARVVLSRAKQMRSGSSSWKRVSSLESVPRSELTFVDPVDAQGRVQFKPLFEGAFLLPYITQRDGPSLVHLQGNKIFTDHVAVELDTFKVKQGVISTKETHLPQTSALFTPRGTKIFISREDTAIQYVDENDRLLWVKDGAADVIVNKQRAPKNGDGFIMYDRRDASSMVHSFTNGYGKLLGGSAGAIGITGSADQYHVCYFPMTPGRNSKVYCLASFSGNSVCDEVFKTLDIVVFNGILHVNLFNTMVPFWTDLKCQKRRQKVDGDEIVMVPAGVSTTMKAFRLADNSRQTLDKTRNMEHSTLRSRCGRFVSALLSRGRVVGDLLTGTSFCVKDGSQDRPNFVFPYLNGQTPAFIRWERSTGISFFNQLSSHLATLGNRASFIMPKIEYNLAEKKKYRFKHYDPVGPELGVS